MKVTINIAGPMRSGKTTIAQELEEWLRTLGVPAEITEGSLQTRTPHGSEPRFAEEEREKNLRNLAERGLEVEIMTTQTNKPWKRKDAEQQA